MPFGLLLLLDIALVYHAARTGRLQPWAFIILMIPVLGALAYVVVELLPEWLGGATAQQYPLLILKKYQLIPRSGHPKCHCVLHKLLR